MVLVSFFLNSSLAGGTLFCGVTASGDGEVCQDLLVKLRSTRYSLRYFDFFNLLGRYRRLPGLVQWNQLHGRHSLFMEDAGSVFSKRFVTSHSGYKSHTCNRYGMVGDRIPCSLTSHLSKFLPKNNIMGGNYKVLDLQFEHQITHGDSYISSFLQALLDARKHT